MRYIKTALYTTGCCIIFASIIYGCLVLKTILDPIRPDEVATESFNPVYHNERYKKAREFHGVLITEWDQEKRELGFYRDGQWCSLYRSIPKGE